MTLRGVLLLIYLLGIGLIALGVLREWMHRSRGGSRATVGTTSECMPLQYSDRMVCRVCGQQWDTNDLDPPACPHPAAVRR